VGGEAGDRGALVVGGEVEEAVPGEEAGEAAAEG